MNILLQKHVEVKPYQCDEILTKQANVTCADFHPNGYLVACGTQNGAILIYNFFTHNTFLSYIPPTPMGKITQIRCSKELVYTISDTGVFMAWNYVDCVVGPIEFDVKFPGFDIRQNEVLIFGKANIFLYDYEITKSIARSEAHEWFGAFLPDSRILALSAKENVLYLLSPSGDDLIT